MSDSWSDEEGRSTVHIFDVYRLAPARRSLHRADGSAVRLPGKAFDTLVFLVRHAGSVVERPVLLQAVWPRRVVEDNNVNQAIALLRRAIGPNHIVTVAGRGYQFVTPVRQEIEVDEQATERAPVAAPRWRRLVLGVLSAAVILIGARATLLRDSRQVAERAPDLGTIVSVTPLTTEPGEETTPAMSPDGSRVAFSWNGGQGDSAIYVAQIGHGTRGRLTEPADGAAAYPAWSPDGGQIAFIRQHDASRFDVVVVPSVGGHERTLYSGERYWISRDGFPFLAWTPDSRQIWFTTRRAGKSEEATYGLHRLLVASGNVEPLTLGGATDDYDTSPAISPDGSWLAFTRYRRGERLNQLMLQRLTADFVPVGPSRVIADAGLHHSLAWAPGGDRLWFVKGGQVLEWKLDGTLRVAALAGSPLGLSEVAFGRNGSGTRAAAVMRAADTDIFALTIDPQTHSAVGGPAARVRSTASDLHPQFSPNGEQLAFVSDRTGERALWIADRDGARLRQITNLKELITGFPRWSPDGSRLAFHTSAANEQRVIYTVASAGGAPRRLSNGCCPSGWSADGRYVYAHEPGPVNRLMRVDAADGTTEVLFEGELGVESADGRYLLYSKSRERGYFRRALDASPGASAEEKLVSDYRPAIGGIAPVKDGFFYVGLASDDQPRALRFYDYSLREARDVSPAPAGIALGLTVSPDGRELLYAAQSGEPNADIVLLEFGAHDPP